MSDAPVPVPLPPPGPCSYAQVRLEEAERAYESLDEAYAYAVGQRDGARMRVVHYLWNFIELIKEAFTDWQGEIPADVQDTVEDWDRGKGQLDKYMNDSIANPFPAAYVSILVKDAAGTLSDLISIGWSLSWAVAALGMAVGAQAYANSWQAELDVLGPLVDAARDDISDARQSLIDCLEHVRTCAVCAREFLDVDGEECAGCQGWFCESHFIPAVEKHELEGGTPAPSPAPTPGPS